MRYHVRVLAGNLDPGTGSHVYHRELIRRLAARGHRVSVICFEKTTDLSDVEVFVVPRSPYRQGPFIWRFSALLDLYYCSSKLSRLKPIAPDIVICGEHMFLQKHRRMFPGTPLIYFPHAPIAIEEIKHYGLTPINRWVTCLVYDYLQRWGLDHADRTVRFTRLACEMLQSRYGPWIRPRFFVNPVGIDPPNGAVKVAPRNPTRLLSVGRLVTWKGIDLVLQLLSNLTKYAWQFDIVGEGGARASLEDLTSKLGLRDRVRFHGFQPDLAPWYRAADLFLFPSKCEGLGLVMLDAMSYGVPCIAIRSDNVRYVNVNEEIIINEHTGILADDERDFHRQLERALAEPDRLIPLGRAARRRIVEHFTWDRHLDRYEELFDELVRGRVKTLDAVSKP